MLHSCHSQKSISIGSLPFRAFRVFRGTVAGRAFGLHQTATMKIPSIENIDDSQIIIASELLFAEITENKVSHFWRNGLESGVKIRLEGNLHGWSFKRHKDYWQCVGAGIPLAPAMRLHEKFGTVVRVDGLPHCPSPLEIFQGFGTGFYHVDDLDGLKELAMTIKGVFNSARSKSAYYTEKNQNCSTVEHEK